MDITAIHNKLLRGEATADEQAEAASILVKLGMDHNHLLAENDKLRDVLLTLMELIQGIEAKTQKIDTIRNEMIDLMSREIGISL